MNPADYDAWYAEPRGRWIGETEYRLASHCLQVIGILRTTYVPWSGDCR